MAPKYTAYVKDGQVSFYDADKNESFWVPQAEAQRVSNETGLLPESPEEYIRREYDSPAMGAALGVARSLTMGASDFIVPALHPEGYEAGTKAVQRYTEQNPVASFAGDALTTLGTIGIGAARSAASSIGKVGLKEAEKAVAYEGRSIREIAEDLYTKTPAQKEIEEALIDKEARKIYEENILAKLDVKDLPSPPKTTRIDFSDLESMDPTVWAANGDLSLEAIKVKLKAAKKRELLGEIKLAREAEAAKKAQLAGGETVEAIGPETVTEEGIHRAVARVGKSAYLEGQTHARTESVAEKIFQKVAGLPEVVAESGARANVVIERYSAKLGQALGRVSAELRDVERRLPPRAMQKLAVIKAEKASEYLREALNAGQDYITKVDSPEVFTKVLSDKKIASLADKISGSIPDVKVPPAAIRGIEPPTAAAAKVASQTEAELMRAKSIEQTAGTLSNQISHDAIVQRREEILSKLLSEKTADVTKKETQLAVEAIELSQETDLANRLKVSKQILQKNEERLKKLVTQVDPATQPQLAEDIKRQALGNAKSLKEVSDRLESQLDLVKQQGDEWISRVKSKTVGTLDELSAIDKIPESMRGVNPAGLALLLGGKAAGVNLPASEIIKHGFGGAKDILPGWKQIGTELARNVGYSAASAGGRALGEVNIQRGGIQNATAEDWKDIGKTIGYASLFGGIPSITPVLTKAVIGKNASRLSKVLNTNFSLTDDIKVLGENKRRYDLLSKEIGVAHKNKWDKIGTGESLTAAKQAQSILRSKIMQSEVELEARAAGTLKTMTQVAAIPMFMGLGPFRFGVTSLMMGGLVGSLGTFGTEMFKKGGRKLVQSGSKMIGKTPLSAPSLLGQIGVGAAEAIEHLSGITTKAALGAMATKQARDTYDVLTTTYPMQVYETTKQGFLQAGYDDETADEFAQQKKRTVEYLQSLVPEEGASQDKHFRFAQENSWVQNPNIIFQSIAAGKDSPLMVEHMRTLYPEFYKTFTEKLLSDADNIKSSGQQLTTQQKRTLDLWTQNPNRNASLGIIQKSLMGSKKE